MDDDAAGISVMSMRLCVFVNAFIMYVKCIAKMSSDERYKLNIRKYVLLFFKTNSF